MSEQFILYLVIAIVLFNYIVNLILDKLNDNNRKMELDEAGSEIYDAEKYKKSMRYSKEHSRLGYWSSTISLLGTLAVLYFGLFGWLDSFLAARIEHQLLLPLVYFGVLFVVSDVLSIPFDCYTTFVIEEKYGFNKMTIGLYLKDKLKSYLITIIIGGGLLVLFLWLLSAVGQQFWWWFWLAMIAFMLIMNMFYSSLILPIFNKLTPLEDGELRTAIQEYCDKVGFPLTNLYVIDGSKRSAKANAFFSGIGRKKKIVLYDTLIENHSKDELVSILAHEVGHYKKRHVYASLFLAILQSGLMLYLLSLILFEPKLSLAMGASTWAPHINLIVFGILYSPMSMILSILMNILSRKNEFEADEYAAKTYNAKSLQNALKKLSVDNLSNLYPHKAYVFIHYSHPPLLDRLKALNKSVG